MVTVTCDTSSNNNIISATIIYYNDYDYEVLLKDSEGVIHSMEQQYSNGNL